MEHILDELFYAMVESKPCPYLHDPVYRAYDQTARALEDRLAEQLGESFRDALTAAESNLSYFTMKQSFLAGLRLGLRMAFL